MSVVRNAPKSPRWAAKPIRQPQRETTPRNCDSARTVALERPAWTGRKLTKIKKIKKVKVDADTQNRTPANENKRGTHLPLRRRSRRRGWPLQ